MNAPIFIVGANRSGTTVLRLILNAHSKLAIPDEIVYFTHSMAGPWIHSWHAPGMSSEDFSNLVLRFLTKNEESLRPLDIRRLHAQIVESGAPDLRRPYQMALEAWAIQRGKVRWGEKTPGNLFYVGAISDMFKDAKFLHIVRDPRAGVNSMNETRLFTGDTTINALNRRRYMIEGLGQLEAVVPSSQRTSIRYEDLVSDPEATIASVCEFVGESFEAQMIDFYKDSASFMHPRAVREFNIRATSPLNRDRTDAWRNKLSAEEVAVVEHICRDEMRRFEYRPISTSLSPSGWLVMTLKRAYWHIQCWRNRRTPGYLVKYLPFQRTRRRLSRSSWRHLQSNTAS